MNYAILYIGIEFGGGMGRGKPFFLRNLVEVLLSSACFDYHNHCVLCFKEFLEKLTFFESAFHYEKMNIADIL